MSCLPAAPTFRLLDAFVGWDPDADLGTDASAGLIGLDLPSGIRLSGDEQGAIPSGSAMRWLPPSTVAGGCGPCEFWLATPDRGLLYRGPCDACFRVMWTGVWVDDGIPELIAVAAAGNRVAVLEAGGRGWILLASTLQVLARFEISEARLLAFNRRGELLVVYGDAGIAVVGPDGDVRTLVHRPAPEGRIDGIAEDDDDRVWVLTEVDGRSRLSSSDAPAEPWEPRTVAQLAAETVDQRVVAANAYGFCLAVPGDGVEETTCWDPSGCPAHLPELTVGIRGLRRGQLLTDALDSGIRRCEWHRLRARVHVPEGTTLEISVASSTRRLPASPGSAPSPWDVFPEGRPHPRDWQILRAESGAVSLDALIQQPPGRYLYVRVRMTSTSTATPIVQQIRLDMPRVTSAAHLPAVYVEDPAASDFTRRFLALFDTVIDDHDAAIERMPALFDVARTPGPVLAWLATFYDIELDAQWTDDQRRALLAEAPELSRRRGTPEGVLRTIELAFPSDEWLERPPVLRELGLERPWGGVGHTTQLGSVRLFGRSKARMRLGTSALGSAPVRSFGDPRQDAVQAVSGRFEIVLPPLTGWDSEELRERVQRLVDAIKPAHTVGIVRVGGGAFGVGIGSAVGVDTIAVAPAPAVLDGGIKLGRRGVLGRGTPGPDWRVGRGRAGGHTVVE